MFPSQNLGILWTRNVRWPGKGKDLSAGSRLQKKAKLLSLAHKGVSYLAPPGFPSPFLSFQLLVRNRPFQWLCAPVQAVFSAWNALL